VTHLLKALLGSSLVGTFQRKRSAAELWKCYLRVHEWAVAIQSMSGDVKRQCVGIT
jgi:hypothetical protein